MAQTSNSVCRIVGFFEKRRYFYNSHNNHLWIKDDIIEVLYYYIKANEWSLFYLKKYTLILFCIIQVFLWNHHFLGYVFGYIPLLLRVVCPASTPLP